MVHGGPRSPGTADAAIKFRPDLLEADIFFKRVTCFSRGVFGLKEQDGPRTFRLAWDRGLFVCARSRITCQFRPGR